MNYMVERFTRTCGGPNAWNGSFGLNACIFAGNSCWVCHEARCAGVVPLAGSPRVRQLLYLKFRQA